MKKAVLTHYHLSDFDFNSFFFLFCKGIGKDRFKITSCLLPKLTTAPKTNCDSFESCPYFCMCFNEYSCHCDLECSSLQAELSLSLVNNL